MKPIIYVNERNGVVCKDYPNAQVYFSEEAVRSVVNEICEDYSSVDHDRHRHPMHWRKRADELVERYMGHLLNEDEYKAYLLKGGEQ